MTNHVHLVAVLETEDGLRLAISETHRRYNLRLNRREGWTGHRWQGRFSSFVMDESYLLATARYIERDPVKVEIVKDPVNYRWSSTKAHPAAKGDHLVKIAPLLKLVPDWRSSLDGKEDDALIITVRLHERTGRPLGEASFFDRLLAKTGLDMHPKKPGRKRKSTGKSVWSPPNSSFTKQIAKHKGKLIIHINN